MRLQSDSARLHTLKRDIEQLLRNLFSSFVKPAAMNQGHLMDVDIKSTYNMKEKHMFIEGKARMHLAAGMEEKEKEEFFKNVVTLYRTACNYITQNIHTKKEVLWRHAEVADPQMRKTIELSSMSYFLRRFPCLLPEGATEDILEQQFNDFTAEEEIPVLAIEEAQEFWQMMATIKDHTGNHRFQHLAAVMQGILLIPVSNAACERIFSLVRKTKTDFRPNMNSKTLEAVLTLKSKTETCHSVSLSDDLLKKCKQATKSTLSAKHA